MSIAAPLAWRVALRRLASQPAYEEGGADLARGCPVREVVEAEVAVLRPGAARWQAGETAKHSSLKPERL
jgi:hypothetical protein